MTRDQIERAAMALWRVRQELYAEVGAEPLEDWHQQPEATRRAVRREAEAACRAV